MKLCLWTTWNSKKIESVLWHHMNWWDELFCYMNHKSSFYLSINKTRLCMMRSDDIILLYDIISIFIWFSHDLIYSPERKCYNEIDMMFVLDDFCFLTFISFCLSPDNLSYSEKKHVSSQKSFFTFISTFLQQMVDLSFTFLPFVVAFHSTEK